MSVLTYKRWSVTIKEKNSDLILHPSLYGYYEREDVIKWFGLNDPDVECYKIELL